MQIKTNKKNYSAVLCKKMEYYYFHEKRKKSMYIPNSPWWCRLVEELVPFPLRRLSDEVVAAVSVAVTEEVEEAGVIADEVAWVTSGSGGCPALRRILFIDDTEGIEFGSQIRWANNWSLISQANKLGLSDFSLKIRLTTDGVATC